MKNKNILLLALLGFGAFYLYQKSKSKPTEITSDKEGEDEEQEEATSGGGGSFQVPVDTSETKIEVDDSKPIESGVEISVETPKEESKLEVQPFDLSKLEGSSEIDGDKLLADIQKMQTKGGMTLPTTSMGMPSSSSKITVNPKMTTMTLSNPTEDKKEVEVGSIKTTMSFYDFDGDELDSEQFIID